MHDFFRALRLGGRLSFFDSTESRMSSARLLAKASLRDLARFHGQKPLPGPKADGTESRWDRKPMGPKADGAERERPKGRVGGDPPQP
ncbi:hypothetical protein GCM10009555_075610 [Acrocarpospora macrocephala]|uniref:Uncharacterized protein n=1 Tax=Acrocarpospora macrocephala TaxID=150177 RepID=A0A5M3X821_9ACTN|nr:hypothetical protein Amac_103940 [Acrocarpospora macrocephala]